MQNETFIEKVSGLPLLIGYLGVLLMLIGAIVLLPLLTLLFYPQELHEAKYFILPGMASLLCGYLMYFQIRGKEKGQLQRNQDALIVVLCWILAILITAVPFMLSKQYTFTQAVFETTSGWSTTGLSVVDVEHTSHLFLMHRSILLFFGGIGLVLVMVSVFSDTYGMRLYAAEGHSDRLLPNLWKSARIIISIYICYIISGVVLYVLCGMPVFDAIIHSIGALSTGGFSSHADSIGYYHSAAIEGVTIVLMLLGNINFLAHLFLLRGKFRSFFRYCEVRFSFLLLALATPVLGVLFMFFLQGSLSQGMRIGLFQAVSALTTTGFQTIPSFAKLPSAIMLIMIVLQLIGGGIGSTAGGIKQYRVYVLVKSIQWKIEQLLLSSHVIKTHTIQRVDGKETIQDQEVSQIALFTFFYILIFFLGSFLLCCYGHSLSSSMFEFSSALSTVGLSSGIMTHDAPAFVLWVGTIGMLIGRLEIYVVLLAGAHLLHDVRKGIRGRHRS